MSAAISSSVRPSAAVRVMKPPTGPGRCALQDSLQALALFVARDLARHAHVLQRRHVDHVAARQRDVRSDARAFLAQRLLGDLDDDLLAFFQQIADRDLTRRQGETTMRSLRLFACARPAVPFGLLVRPSGRPSCCGLPSPPLRTATAAAPGAARDAMRKTASTLAHLGASALAFYRRCIQPGSAGGADSSSAPSCSAPSFSSMPFDFAQDHRLDVAGLRLRRSIDATAGRTLPSASALSWPASTSLRLFLHGVSRSDDIRQWRRFYAAFSSGV